MEEAVVAVVEVIIKSTCLISVGYGLTVISLVNPKMALLNLFPRESTKLVETQLKLLQSTVSPDFEQCSVAMSDIQHSSFYRNLYALWLQCRKW